MRISNKTSVIAFMAGLICLLVYLKTLPCGFVNYDDPLYVLDNPLIRRLDWSMLASVFTRPHLGWWMPLTWVSLAIDYHVWGVNPFGYHLTNIVLHAVNTALIVLLADRLYRIRFSKEADSFDMKYLYPGMLLLAGLLFGIHPLRVESVAWVTERKDVLNGLFYLGSMLFYLRYAQGKEEGGERASREYIICLVLFILSLMAKSVSVVMPAMLLVVDWYPLGRLRRGRIRAVLIEKLPFLFFSVLMIIITFHFTSESRYLVSYDVFPFGQRLVVSGNAIYEYCRLHLYPVGILPYHMIPDPIPASYAINTLVALLFSCFWVVVGRKYPSLIATWLAFMLPLLPVLAFFQNGDQAFAARFTYLPAMAPSIAAAAIIIAAYNKAAGILPQSRYVVTAAIFVLLLLYAGITVRLIDVWKSPETFWSRVIDLEPEVLAFKERGRLYHAAGKYDAAIKDFSAAIGIASGGFQDTIYNLYAFRGESLRATGRFNEAVNDFNAAIALLPHPAYYRHRGLALEALGKVREAEEDFRRAGPEIVPLEWYWREGAQK